MGDLDRFRQIRGRGTNELTVFANETYFLIQQMTAVGSGAFGQ